MIDCPICHVKNHDDARFCAECGQRLNGPVQPTAQQPSAPGQPGAPQADNPRPAAPRLHSPLLGEAEPPHTAAPGSAADVNRLRQMSSRQRDETSQMGDAPYKNPYDPRYAAGQESPTQQGNPTVANNEHNKHKLRSPLLSGEEFSDEPALDDQPDEQPSGRSGLRSPLLGGGKGSYGGPERRGEAPTYQQFAGQERRRSHLHSPLLHNTDSYYYDEQGAAPEEEPIDEDNPNVLRSPLLAAKRPLNDRPPVNAPSASNTQTPARPAQAADAKQFGTRPEPTSSYTSLRSMSSSNPQAAPAANPPPAPADAQSQSGGYQFGVGQAPASVPPAFQNMQAQPPATRPASTPPRSDDTIGGTGSGSLAAAPNVQAPLEAPRKAASRLLPADYSDERDALPARQFESQPASPLPKLIGAIAVVLLLAKGWVFLTFMGTDWSKFSFLVVDQLVGAALIVCLIVLAFSRSR